MNVAAVLALMGDLYQQLTELKVENTALRAELARRDEEPREERHDGQQR